MKKKVYVAGQYSTGYVIENIRNAVDVGDYLMAIGFVPFIPHLTGFWDLLCPHTYEEWMVYDAEWLKSCDCVLRLPGESQGADREVKMALSLGIPVYYSPKDLVEAENGK